MRVIMISVFGYLILNRVASSITEKEPKKRWQGDLRHTYVPNIHSLLNPKNISKRVFNLGMRRKYQNFSPIYFLSSYYSFHYYINVIYNILITYIIPKQITKLIFMCNLLFNQQSYKIGRTLLQEIAFTQHLGHRKFKGTIKIYQLCRNYTKFNQQK